VKIGRLCLLSVVNLNLRFDTGFKLSLRIKPAVL